MACSFICFTNSIFCPNIVRLSWSVLRFRFWVNIIAFVLVLDILNPHSFDQFSIIFNTAWRSLIASFGQWCFLQTVLSSAYPDKEIFLCSSKVLWRVLIIRLKSMGLMTLPWGQPFSRSCCSDKIFPNRSWGARWLSGRVSDSGARGPGFETYRRRVVSLSKTLYSPKVLVNYPGSDGSVPTWLKNCWLGR